MSKHLKSTNMEFKGTKGGFYDGHTGWKINPSSLGDGKGFEIIWSDDTECVTDHVYTIEDAKLIAAAPDLLAALQELMKVYNEKG